MDSAAPERSLAQANLLRVRGEFKEAKQALLAFLAERPDDREALDLLARTCEDGGEAEEARRWRGLAGAPLMPESTMASTMLAQPVPRWTIPAVVALGLLVIGLGFVIGRSSAPHIATPIMDGRVEAPGTTADPVRLPTKPPVETTGSGITATEPAPQVAPRSEGASASEAELTGLARLVEAEAGAGRALGVTHDPRSDTVVVTFAPRTGETPRREAASLARTAFGTFRTAKTLQMRALRGRELVYMATASRERLAVVEADGWARENEANADALADALLSDEWNIPESADGKSADAKLLGGP